MPEGAICGLSRSPCVLMEFVPNGCRDEKVPCRHIPVNQTGETLNTLYSTATMDEIEGTLRQWLEAEIARFEREVASVRHTDSDAA
jgi:hypothetical protein